MNKKLSTLVFTLLLFLVCGGMAQATYYHFEDLRDKDVAFTKGFTSSWTFDLDENVLPLWLISANQVQNNGGDWLLSSSIGNDHMDASDILHRAYLTMRVCQANGDTVNMFLDGSSLWNEVTFSQQGCTGTIDVFTKLFGDHLLEVKITSVSGDFTVDWINLSGCYETGSTPVPEPGTLILLGLGLALLPFLSRKKH